MLEAGITVKTANKAIRGLLGLTPSHTELLDGGWGGGAFLCEIYEDNRKVVVRIGVEERAYRTEKAVIDRLRDNKICAAACLAEGQIEGRAVSIIQFSEGTPIQQMSDQDPSKDQMLFLMGAELAKVHAVDPDGLSLKDETISNSILQEESRLEDSIAPPEKDLAWTARYWPDKHNYVLHGYKSVHSTLDEQQVQLWTLWESLAGACHN